MNRPEVSKRSFFRHSEIALFSPVSCILEYGDKAEKAEVINYHFKGASLKLPPGSNWVLRDGIKLKLLIGEKCIQDKIEFRVCWQDLKNTGTFGVEFKVPMNRNSTEKSRIEVNQLYPITMAGWDPLNPIRRLYFQITAMDKSTFSLMTSASNNYLFPGMSLDRCQVNMVGQDPIDVEVFIEHVREGSVENTIELEVSLRNPSRELLNAISEYCLVLSPAKMGEDDRNRNFFSKIGIASKTLKSGLNYRVIESDREYEKVLKLRFLGYGKAGKTKAGTSWQEMGEGLKSEGKIIGAFLGAQLVGAMELRFGREMVLRSAKYLSADQLKSISPENVVEPNKLVVHPDFQGTDIVVGMIQRIHALSLVGGKLDVLLLATDKLAPFYNKMGGESLGIKIPHPIISDQFLNVMIFKSEMYSEGVGINPYFWSQIWEVTHDYFTEIGLEKPIQLTLVRAIRKGFGNVLWQLALWKKGLKSKRTGELKPKGRSGSQYIDPKWTTRHLSTNVLVPYIMQADETIGKPNVDSILSAIGVPREYFAVQSNWVSMQFFDEFIESFKKYGDVEKLQRESGRKAMKKEVLGFTYYFIKHFISFDATVKAVGKVATRFNTTRTYQLSKYKPGKCVVTVGFHDVNLLPRDSSACLNWIGNFEGIIELKTGKKAQVNKIACCLKGDESCVYELEWVRKKILPKSVLEVTFFAVSLVGILYYYYCLEDLNVMSGQKISLLFGVGVLSIGYLKSIVGYKQLEKQFESYHQESDDKYSDLQRSKAVLNQNYEEASLLENLARDVQKSDQLTHILNTTATAVCEKFGFKRAFIMLVDQEKKLLRTTAVAGESIYSDLLWGFSVDVSHKRENSLVISSVYFSGQPILIPDVNSYKFQLNTESRNLIEKLKTDGFAMVPIPAIENNWGVLIADKAADKSRIDRRDLKMLQRVAQHLGIALDKKSKFEQEEKLRLIFQKYVPARVINGLPNSEEPVLGGKNIEITCMFLDIRGFTTLSESYPSEVVLDILNKFFSIVHEVSSRNHGLIDKFLGDGVLVTWGTITKDEFQSALAVKSAYEILNRVSELNISFKSLGLPSIEIGIGINSGKALVGNVGAQERMEFTAIGPTVNLASRLEGLCKVYNSKIVISGSVLEKMGQSDLFNWKVIKNVAVRGVENEVSIGVFGKAA